MQLGASPRQGLLWFPVVKSISAKSQSLGVMEDPRLGCARAPRKAAVWGLGQGPQGHRMLARSIIPGEGAPS